MNETQIISASARYLVYLRLTHANGPCSLASVCRGDASCHYRVSRDAARVVLRDAVGLRHARVDASGCYTITDAGLVDLAVQAAVLQSANDYRTRAAGGA